MNILPTIPDPPNFTEEIANFFAELNALLDRLADMCIGAFVLVLVVLAAWGVITLLGRRGR